MAIVREDTWKWLGTHDKRPSTIAAELLDSARTTKEELDTLREENAALRRAIGKTTDKLLRLQENCKKLISSESVVASLLHAVTEKLGD